MSTVEGKELGVDDREPVVPCYPPETAARKALMISEILVLIINHADTRANYFAHAGSQIHTMTAKDPPWPYMLVCKAWYEILSSAPSLWTTILINCGGGYSRTIHLPSMLDYFLRHSKDMPLTLHISAHIIFEDDESRHTLFLNLLGRAFQHQHRWEDVRLYLECAEQHSWSFEGRTCVPYDLNLDIERATMLKRLNIDLPEDLVFHFPKGNIPRVTLARTDNLQYLRLQNVQLLLPNTNPSGILAYFPHLHSLDLCLIAQGSHRDLWPLLRASPNIHSLKVDIWDLEDSSASHSIIPSASLNKLHSLIVDFRSLKLLHALSDRMEVPSLRKLDILHFHLCNNVLSMMANELKFHQNPITELQLDIFLASRSFDENTVAAFFHAFGNLECLRLLSSQHVLLKSFLVVFAKVLSDPQASEENMPNVLPRLRTLDLTVSGRVKIFQDDLALSAYTSIAGDIKKVIMACKRRFPTEFHISIRQENPFSSRQRVIIEENHVLSLLDDVDVRRCITKNFTVSVESEGVAPIAE
ncbi:hypothetical protein SCHPADRAFT_48326 [Schizopora paradoxa]|uniref:F-box domain-containing protein n=1 Tax=Schizopora paradoxa TaxID=27342 RepID=A0A0H2S6X6_9AGAM|nr:hypothetical protein SCHPADRAFT_48326 [Schizopora paradoxa]